MTPLAALAAGLCLLALDGRGGGGCADALASPSKYHFGAGASSASSAARKSAASDRRRRTRPSSYVPDGLTEEQYQQIKDQERLAQEGMEYGRWGPRFAAAGDGDPDGNWFNLPSLWTGGFDAGQGRGTANVPTGEKGAGTETGAGGVVPALTGRLRRYGPAYAMLLVAAEVLSRSLSARRARSASWFAARALLSLAALKPVRMFASFAERRKLKWLRKHGATRLAALMAVLMTSLALALRVR